MDNTVSFITDLLVNSSSIAGMLSKKRCKTKEAPYKNVFLKVKPPKWHDKTCHEIYLSIKSTADLLSKSPKNAWLRGKLVTESKQYNKMLKMKQK